MIMVRILHLLFLALLLGPPVGTWLAPADARCEQSSDCCAPDGTCDDSCAVCPCCAGPAPNVTASVEARPLAAPPGPAAPAPGAAVLPLLSTDILHIPKSL